MHTQKDCNTSFWVQAPWAKRKQTESGNDIQSSGQLHLHESSPQAARSVARAILHIIFLCCPIDCFTRILHLSGYPEGRDRFTSPSVCKLYVDANGIRVMPRIGYGFLCKQYMNKSSKSPFNSGSSGIPDSRSSIFLYQVSQPCFGTGTPSPRTSAAIRVGKVDQGEVEKYMWI